MTVSMVPDPESAAFSELPCCHRALPPVEALTVVGDVHGWANRLDDLVKKIPENDFIVFVGDIIDRGPDSSACVAAVRELCALGRAAMVLGNHEYAMLRSLGGLANGRQADAMLANNWVTSPWGGDATLASYGHADVLAALDDQRLLDDCAWLAGLPWWLEVPLLAGCSVHITHAGLPKAPVQACREWFTHGHKEAHHATCNELPEMLFAKSMVKTKPKDLSSKDYVVSGHVPQRKPYGKCHRYVVDTTGGMADRALAAVRLPDGEFVLSAP